MALSPEEIHSIGNKLDIHNKLVKIALDFDSEDDDCILDALTTLHSLLENKSISVTDIIGNNLSTSLVNLLSYPNADVLIELLEVIILIYQQANRDQRSHFCDLGIHSLIITLLDTMEEDLIPNILYTLSILCSTDHEEQENISNNEIWPTLVSLLSKYQDHVRIVKYIAMLLSTLAKPMNGVRATMNGFSVIMDPMLLIMDLYLPTIRDDFVGEASQKRDSEIIIYNCFIVLLYLMEMDPSNEDYYAIFIDPYLSQVIPHVVMNIQSQFAVICLKIISYLVIISPEICRLLVDEGIIDALTTYMLGPIESEKKVPSYYARWLVLFIVSNLAADSEEVVDLLLHSDLYSLINKEIVDKRVNKGLFVEYVYWISNLVFSASEEQKMLIAESLPVNVIMGIIKECSDKEVCNLAATSVELLVDSGCALNLQETLVFENMNFVASSYSYDPYESEDSS